MFLKLLFDVSFSDSYMCMCIYMCMYIYIYVCICIYGKDDV